MSARLFHFITEPFVGDPEALAEHLRLVGVRVKRSEDHYPCVEYRDGDGRWIREIGEVCVYQGDRVIVWPRSDATSAQQVTLLRAGERVITHGFDGPGEPGWDLRTTSSGRRYRKCTVVVFLDAASSAQAAASCALDVRELHDLSLHLLADWDAPGDAA
jgi:hypothetical protein